MTNLDKVREALKDTVCALEVCGKSYDYVMDEARAALSALSAHEAEVKEREVVLVELVEALKDAVCALEVCGKSYDYVMDKARAALDKVKP